jgi:hypothetical protein
MTYSQIKRMNTSASFRIVLGQNCLHSRREKNNWRTKIQFSLSSNQKWSYITQQIAETVNSAPGINFNHVPSFASIYIPLLSYKLLNPKTGFNHTLPNLDITPSYHPLLTAAFLQLSY